MLSIKNKLKDACDFCSSSNISYVYTPIRSKRGMEVVFCNDCGLFESISTIPYKSRPPGNLSCDADRSSLKITKGLTFVNYRPLLEEYFISSDSVNIIDIGSNRGTFVEWAESNLNIKEITAIETDVLITEDYAKNNNLDLIIGRFEEIHDLKANHYDIAYCVHTLEHATSAFLMLNKIYDCLNLNGIFFLAVPNLNWSDDALVEYFIDPHTFHFDSYALENFIKKTGFEILHKNDHEHFESIYVLKKTSNVFFRETDRGFKLGKKNYRKNHK
jgi:2-polyprenyl-3-methyl-5-hydroxy-6-metoxy-1,4-benzoquinol methylase